MNDNMTLTITGADFDSIPVNQVIPHSVPNESMRGRIVHLEQTIIDMNLGDEADPAKHFHAPGTYGRQLFIPADQLIVGKIHKYSHINIISSGIINVVTEFGVARYDATDHPVTFISEPGTKRVVYAVTDTYWTCVHATNEKDLEKIEDEVIAKTYNDLQLGHGG